MSKKTTYYSKKITLIIGGASGIGAALGHALAGYGSIIILADIQGALAEKVADDIRVAGGEAKSVSLDVCNYKEFQQAIDEILKEYGRLDLLFNNAGIGVGGYASDHEVEDWKKIIDINLLGVVNGVQCGYRVMREQGFGHIINTASMAGLVPSPAMVAYSATKSAVVGLSQALRPEAAEFGVSVSVLCPGAIKTPILEGGGKNGKMVTAIPLEQQLALFEPLGPISSIDFAKKALEQIEKNKEIIVIPSKLKILWWLERLLPSLPTRIAYKQMKEILEPLGLKR
jgi:NAD(P)-dependent dehydrogenase (short-subunit alcohol dehydrogenase family)|tara:strand:+ start:694 stop:1548 length:855 start_codon:yes stop_codon:yes gene_type:complete